MRKHGNSKEWQPERGRRATAFSTGVSFSKVRSSPRPPARASTEARAEPLPVPSWMKQPGAAFSAYGQPSRFESKVVRSIAAAAQSRDPGHRHRAHAAPSCSTA